MRPTTADAYRLFHEGSIALSRVEQAGICVDVPYVEKTKAETESKIADLESDLRDTDLGRKWRRRFGAKANLTSNPQLAVMLTEEGHDLPRTEKTKGLPDGHKKIKYKTDVEAIETIDDPFIPIYLEIEKLKKVSRTYFACILREVINGKCHVNFGLTRAITYRSNSDNFNFQNLAARNEAQAKLVRSSFIPRPGRRIGEIDFGGIEVCIAACYHKDPRMIEYITDKSKDMHRDMAAQCYCIKPKHVSKQARYAGKNMFVFPQFYGDYFRTCAESMWAWMNRKELTLQGSDRLVSEALARKGITELGACDRGKGSRPVAGTFEHHIQQVEKHFWNTRFPVYKGWKESWFGAYSKTGSFKTKTGFEISGVMGKNDVINYPVQGAAFHCLLQCLIWIQKELHRRKMKTLIIGQIHDSIVADIVEEELEEFLGICQYIMTVYLLKKWKWIIVPMEVEAEVTPIDGTWYQKKVYAA